MTDAPPWLAWEDYTAGMYRADTHAEHQTLSAALLRDVDYFREAAREMLRAWPVSAERNLRLLDTGRNAWLGQASCCYAHGATAADTRRAWGTLTNAEQRAANECALTVREEWSRETQDAQALFEL